MGGRLFFDPEGGPAPILEHLDESALLGGGGKPKLRSGRDDHIFLAAHQHRAAVGAGGDDVARLERGAPNGCRGAAAMPDLDRSGRLRHPPAGDLRECGMAPEEHEDGKGAQEHGR
jgi:hypothetical protein